MEKKTLSKLTKTEERKYSLLWLIFWIIFCFPVAYYYYFKKQYPTKEILKEKPQKYIFMGLVVLYVIFLPFGIKDALKAPPTYTNDALYDCQEGKYSFPENEPVFEKLELFVIDYNGLEENKCVIFPTYKIKVKPDPSDFYYEMDTDTCDLTVSQLAYFKEKHADLMTMLRDANCDFKTNLFLPEVGKNLGFKGQV